MSCLFVYHISTPDTPNKVLTHFDDIASTLAEQAVVFQRWHADVRVEAGASEAEVISAYQQRVDALMTEGGYAWVNVLSIAGDGPQKIEAQLLQEHRHDADELRLFAAGRGLFSLHIGDYVYAVLCEKGDMISVPAGTARWFDMGEAPRVVAIRLFSDREGATPCVTGDDIAQGFARLDD